MEGLREVSVRSAGGDGGGVLGYRGSQSLGGGRCPPGLERHGGRGVDWCRQLSCVCFGAGHWAKGGTTSRRRRRRAWFRVCTSPRNKGCGKRQMIIHMWRRWKYSTFPVDESKRAGSVLALFFFWLLTRCNRQRRGASRRCNQRHSSSIMACARDCSMHFSAKLSSN